MGRARLSSAGGFTLLEVLVAFAILSVAIVTLIELTSQGLRLLKFSGEHQEAIQLADRLARDAQIDPDSTTLDTPAVDTGEDGNYRWERRIERVPLPDEIESRATIPGKEVPGLYTVSVAVSWGRNQKLEVATVRLPTPEGSTPPPTLPDTQSPVQPSTTQSPGQSTPGTSGIGSSPSGTTTRTTLPGSSPGTSR